MTSTSQSNVNFRHIFRDIVSGWSKIIHNKQDAYLKHLSVFDQVDIEDVKNFYYEKAKSRGLPTESESLSRLEEEGLWTSADEGKIKQEQDYLKNSETSKKQLYLKAEIDRANEEIEASKKKLLQLQNEKS